MPGQPAQMPRMTFLKTILQDLQEGRDDVLSVYRANDGRLFMRLQCEESEEAARLLWYEVGHLELEQAEDKQLTNLDLILGSREIYLQEANEAGETLRAHRVNRFDVEAYHSTSESYFPN
jgi:hypothetical protein